MISKKKINLAVFPGHQGGPHCNSIAGIAVALRQATEPHYRQYQEQVLKNCKAMVKRLKELGYSLMSGGSDNHLVVVDLRNKNADETIVQLLCNKVKLFLTDVPNGVRLGTPALTTRGLKEKDFENIADFFDQAVAIASEVKTNKLVLINENPLVAKNNSPDMEIETKMDALRQEIETFASKSPIPGFDDH